MRVLERGWPAAMGLTVSLAACHGGTASAGGSGSVGSDTSGATEGTGSESTSGTDETTGSTSGSETNAESTGSETSGADSTTGEEDPPDVVEIVAGRYHTCARSELDQVRCWGWGLYGTLGYGNTEDIGDDEVPAGAGDVDIGEGRVVQLSAGVFHNCALLDGGTVRCWGPGDHGRLGYDNTDSIGDDEVPSVAGDVDVGGPVVQISAGFSHTCALLQGGKVRCWGDNWDGKLGYGHEENIGDDETPASAGDVDVGGTVLAVSAGSEHTCALLDTKAVRCWGDGQYGALGYGNEVDIGDDEAPSVAGDVDVGGPVAAIASGYEHTCVLLENGAVRCWGHAEDGRIGYGNLEDIGDDESPTSAGDLDIGGIVVQLSGQESSHCVRLDDDAVRCWGLGDLGMQGHGNTEDVGDDETPAQAGDVDIGAVVIDLATAGHTCVRVDNGGVKCWGWGDHGTLGYGNTQHIGDNELPSAVGLVQVF